MIRTSESHPLRIDSLSVGIGRLGLTFCPGKKGPSVFGLPWNRDLKADLDQIAAWGAATVVTLLEDHEFEALSVGNLGEKVQTRGLEWYHFPIPDVSVPSPEAMKHWPRLSAHLHSLLDDGGDVLVHCRGGRGRAGTVAALLLVERGWSAADAIAEIRRVRQGAIETHEQESCILSQDRGTD